MGKARGEGREARGKTGLKTGKARDKTRSKTHGATEKRTHHVAPCSMPGPACPLPLASRLLPIVKE